MRRTFFCLVVVLLMAGNEQLLFAQVSGCTDLQASNYQATASQNNGSCKYNFTAYKPNVRFHLPKEVDETSGLVFWRNYLWTHNDSGGLPVLYKLDTTDGTVIQRIRLANATNVDWEELASDSLFIYVGDFGNNNGHRHDLVIYKIRKSDIPEKGDTSVSAGKISFTYPDYPAHIANRSKNNYDCEAMVSVDDSLYLFSKDWEDSETRMYRLPKTPGNYVTDLVSRFNTAGLVTAADYQPTRKEMVLLGYTRGNWIPFMWLLWDFKGHAFFSGNKRRIDMPKVKATQTEGFVFSNGEGGFISSEGNPLFRPAIYHFNIGQWTHQKPASLKQVKITPFEFSLSPNPVTKRKLSVHLKNIPLKTYSLELYDSAGKQILPAKFKTTRKKGKTSIKLMVSFLKPGIYFVRLHSGKFMAQRKFIRK